MGNSAKESRLGKVNKLALACLSCLLFGAAPCAVLALGLGDLKIASNLNEPLEASISIEDAKGIIITDILVTIADPKEFTKAGLEPAAWLQRIQFTVDQNKQGGLVVKLNTQRPVQEPFADLLIQVTWPGGKILKEYTLLLDPPKVVMTQPKISSAKAQEVFHTLSATATQSEAPRKVASLVKQPFNALVSDAQDRESVHFGGRFGPVHDETLWRIAKRLVANSNYSIYQGVMAIATKNPDAFTNGNINHIKRGAVLLLPLQAEVNKYSKDEARQFVENQTLGGQSMIAYAPKEKHRQKSQQTHVQAQSQSQEQQQPNEVHKALKLVEHTEPKEIKSNTSTTHPNEEKQTSLTTEVVSKRLTMAEEALDTLKRTNEEISQKNTELQNKNDSLAGQLAAKEEEINRLKMTTQVHLQSNESAPPKEIPTKTTLPSQDYVVVTSDPIVEDKPIPVAHREQPKVQTQAAEQKNAVKAVKTKLGAIEKDNFEQDTSEQTKHSDIMKRNFIFIVFMFAFTCSLLGWMWFSRHRLLLLADWLGKKYKNKKMSHTRENNFEKPIVSDLPQEEIQLNFGLQFDLEKALHAVAQEEKKYLKPQVQLSKSDVEADHKKSQSSLEDAEIYIAYERYSQAEKLLQEILTDESPQSTAYWDALLKLLELYVLTQNYHEYDKLYASVPSDLQDIAPKVWSKIKLLQDKVQADKAIPSPKVNPPPKEKLQLSIEAKEDGIALAQHHVAESNTKSDTPLVQEQTITALPSSKLELVADEDEAFNSQIDLVRTYQDIGDNISARDILEKLKPSANENQLNIINQMLSQMSKK